MKDEDAHIPVYATIGHIKVIDNKDFKLAAHSTTPGESCANCKYYNVYKLSTDPTEHNEDGDPIYTEQVLLEGSCTALIPNDLFIFNIPSSHHCKHYTYTEHVFVDDTITEDMEGREM
jgi:hypothetical protein